MFPNNDEIMVRYARSRDREIQAEVEASRDAPFDCRVLRRRLMLLVGVGLVSLTVMLAMVMLGWWVL